MKDGNLTAFVFATVFCVSILLLSLIIHLINDYSDGDCAHACSGSSLANAFQDGKHKVCVCRAGAGYVIKQVPIQ